MNKTMSLLNRLDPNYKRKQTELQQQKEAQKQQQISLIKNKQNKRRNNTVFLAGSGLGVAGLGKYYTSAAMGGYNKLKAHAESDLGKRVLHNADVPEVKRQMGIAAKSIKETYNQGKIMKKVGLGLVGAAALKGGYDYYRNKKELKKINNNFKQHNYLIDF